MAGQEPPRIEFPCDYPIKVLGRSSENFRRLVFEIVERHAPGFDRCRVSMKASRRGKFSSLTIFITATSVHQLQVLHRDLMNTGVVQMVL